MAHLDTTSTVEVILRLIGADDFATAASNEHSAWLGDTSLMAQLLDALCTAPAGSNKLERIQRAAQQNIGNILVAIAHAQCQPMFGQLLEPQYLQRLLGAAAAPRDAEHCDVLHPMLLVCIALLDPKAPRAPMSTAPMAFGMMQSFEPAPDPKVMAARADARTAAASEIVQLVPHFVKLLDEAPNSAGSQAAQQQPYGQLTPPLGRQRITIVEVGKALLRTQEPDAVRSGALVPCADSNFAAMTCLAAGCVAGCRTQTSPGSIGSSWRVGNPSCVA